jgi:hypothetical protein
MGDWLIPVEQSSGSGGVAVPDMPITDGKLTDQIRVLDVQDNIGVVDTDSFPNLNDIVYGVGNSSGTLEVSGVRAVKIYTADANTPPQDALNIDLTKSTGNVDVFMGNHGSDNVLGGAGADHVTTGTGLSDSLTAGVGANQQFTANGAQASLFDNAGGDTNLIFKALAATRLFGSGTTPASRRSTCEAAAATPSTSGCRPEQIRQAIT